ncbi:laminin B domain-containing protein [Spirosoma sp. KCTC 42546]|uniref:laminin B domain-containing protein n=1 Tax=Spirosoma sp. KCTC 42546 TaxID=2520506 RepID=UPI00143D6FA7|nr:laminin B domain-containing protein [Spirosoma sp. KCTC 42546]
MATISIKINGYLLISLLCLGTTDCHEIITPLPILLSTFTQGAAGWQIISNGMTTDAKFSSAGGNPDGYIYSSDFASGIWYFMAPKSVTDQLKFAYGQRLHFDLKQSGTQDQQNKDDVILISGKVKLALKTGHPPGTDWTSYSIKLDESGAWKKNGTSALTEDEFRLVLSNIDQLWIRGEFINGADQGCLDSVGIN